MVKNKGGFHSSRMTKFCTELNDIGLFARRSVVPSYWHSTGGFTLLDYPMPENTIWNEIVLAGSGALENPGNPVKLSLMLLLIIF